MMRAGILLTSVLSLAAASPAWPQPSGHGTGHGDDDDSYLHMVGMSGALGPYVFAREASGTSWQPDSTRHDGLHWMADPWMIMAHGTFYMAYSDQGGPRGAEKGYLAGMIMASARRNLGSEGVLRLRAHLSVDPQIGKSGYPLLFASGETADGIEHLVDRQHPHNLFMELSASYSHKVSDTQSLFIYAGLPGEPAIGPAAYMHRPSAEGNPEAPITHHWLDSTHIANGVVTAGYVHGPLKLEGSYFTGREPDQNRYEINEPNLDSVAIRLSYNPSPNWSAQVSFASIKSPEQLEPDGDEECWTASITHNKPFGDHVWASTLAWGRKIKMPGPVLDALLAETSLTLSDKHTIFARAEWVENNELFDHDSPLHDTIARPIKVSGGYVYDIPIADNVTIGVGGLLSVYSYTKALEVEYGTPPLSGIGFVRLKVQ